MAEKIKHIKRIALVAHDKKKADLADWAEYNRALLSKHKLVATGTTGTILQEKLGVPVEKLLSGPLGGDQQLGAMIAEGRLTLSSSFGTQWKPRPTTVTLRLSYGWRLPGILSLPATAPRPILSSRPR